MTEADRWRMEWKPNGLTCATTHQNCSRLPYSRVSLPPFRAGNTYSLRNWTSCRCSFKIASSSAVKRHYPADYERIREWFPMVETSVKQWEYFHAEAQQQER